MALDMTSLYDEIVQANKAIRPQVPVTPLERSHALSAALGCEAWLKCEHLQPTGSFKVRGAANKIRGLSAEALRAGVVTASSGNHGLAVARTGKLAGASVTVCVAASAAKSKLDAIRAMGAELVVLDAPPIEAELHARRLAALQGQVYISPYNDLEVVAGQGTAGLELFEQVPDLDAVFVAVGGGGLIGGIGTVLKKLRPQARIVGVWPDNSPAMLRAIEAGAIVDFEEQPTLSDGTAGGIEPGSVTLPICREVIDEMVTVSEAEIAGAMRRLAETDHWIVEGSAGVALAGLIKRAQAYKHAKISVVLCGRNISLERFMQAISCG